MLGEGDEIAGRYTLRERIGLGGMGAVWRADQLALGRPVAIKVLRPQDDHGLPDADQRFKREAELAARVEHRNVVSIIDYGVSDEGDHFLVMPLLRGESLEARLKRDLPPTRTEVLAWSRGILSGLAAIHDEGIVHRDLKPANVFLAEDADGVEPKILDFGISRAHAGPADGGLTQAGTSIGTPQYMAPEQFESATQVDHRADIYSTGALLYHAFAGHPPLDGPDPFTIYRRLIGGETPRLGELRPELPVPLTQAIGRAMALRASDRFQSARAMRGALEHADFPAPAADRAPEVAATQVLDGTGRTQVLSKPPLPPPRRGPWLALGITALVLAIAGAAAAGAWAYLAPPGDPRSSVELSNVGDDRPPDPPTPPAPPSLERHEENSTDPPAQPRLGPAGLNSLALEWARLPTEQRRGLRFERRGQSWVSVAVEHVNSRSSVVEPRLMQTQVRLNLRARALADATTLRTMAHDTIVVALIGEVAGGTSTPSTGDESEPRPMTYFVASESSAGWAVSHLLATATVSCLPTLPAEVDGEEAERDATLAATWMFENGVRVDAIMIAARDRQSLISSIAFYRPVNRCELPLEDRIAEYVIHGIVDEFFLSEVAPAETLLLVGWQPTRARDPEGMRTWGAFRVRSDSPFWLTTLPSAAYLARGQRAAVSGTRDRIMRSARRRGNALTIRRPGEPRVWYDWQDEQLILVQEEAPEESSEGRSTADDETADPSEEGTEP